ncbi:tetratricopeptide repeat protein [Ideonella azotifigens]|uniref:Tetratricopeptide repeat protein n=1 Tax=Ideonella azotifigens TaxID=513160 RepID=A0ABN1JXA8_9BURK|nr:tetratricopeptide repeat protein [Ideonella azotifigens]MCD2341294.1 tetratricopeptide repeat protein [Ideonella azotifigens]
MSVPLSLVPQSALDYFSALVTRDDEFALLEAAILLGQDAHPALDVQAVLAEIDRLGEQLRRRLPGDAAPLHRLRVLNRYFFNELGFGANANHFYDPDNSYVHRVLVTRRGIPISLALIFIELAEQIGLQARGISFPGHFLVKLRMPAGEVILDPINGRSLSREELEERLEPFVQQQGLIGEFETPLGLFLQAAAPRDMLARMLGNLKAIHRQSEDWVALLAVQQRLVCLLPEQWEERRDRGLVYAELGQAGAALSDLVAYLQHCPAAPDVPALEARVEALRGSPRPLLH